MTDIIKYNDILLKRLHRTIKENNVIFEGKIKCLNYDIIIDPVIEKIEKKSKVLCNVSFYVKAPIFKNIFLEHTSGLSNDEEKAIFLASDNFVFCALDGILDFFNGIFHYEINTPIVGDIFKFTVCESPMVELGSREYIKTEGYDKDKHSSFLWDAIKEELIFMLGHLRFYYIKVFAAKMPNDDVIAEVRINDIIDDRLGNIVVNEIKKIDSYGEFLSFKQFFFILQDDSSYVRYPYSQEEILYFVNEALFELERVGLNYNEYKKNISNIIFDHNIYEEIINFFPEICAQNSFKDFAYDERMSVFIGNKEYRVYKSQFTSYAMIEESLLKVFNEKLFKEETYKKLVSLSETYKIIKDVYKRRVDIKRCEIGISVRFTSEYKPK